MAGWRHHKNISRIGGDTSMKPELRQELSELFQRFANEEQASSFAVNSLLGQTIQIIQKHGERKVQAPPEEIKKGDT